MLADFGEGFVRNQPNPTQTIYATIPTSLRQPASASVTAASKKATKSTMASATTQHLLLSPAELAYLHASLSLSPPVRPDGRGATQFRPLTAETDVLPGTNGSARVCFADGTEAVVGVKAEVGKTRVEYRDTFYENRELRRKGKGKTTTATDEVAGEDEEEEEEGGLERVNEEGEGGSNDWVEITVEIPGHRDDDSSTVFLATMLSEALLADGQFTKKLWINRRFHWKLYIDVSALIYLNCKNVHEANIYISTNR